MQQFDELIRVADRLLSPEGCPWDLKQTFATLRPYLLEETHEVMEAVDLDEDSKMVEELGDLLYIIIFYAKLAEKQRRFSLAEILDTVREKLVRRHPHIFAGVKVESIDEVKENWEKIKKEEKTRESVLDGIPPTLPSVVRAQKVIERIDQISPLSHPDEELPLSEQEIGERLFSLIVTAHRSGVNAEMALRQVLAREEQGFRHREKQER